MAGVRPVEFAGARIDADLRQRHLARHLARQLFVGLEQPPSVGDGQYRLALLAYAAQIGDQIVERLDRRLLLAPLDHLVSDAAIVDRRAVRAGHRRLARIAHLILLFLPDPSN